MKINSQLISNTISKTLSDFEEVIEQYFNHYSESIKHIMESNITEVADDSILENNKRITEEFKKRSEKR